MTATTPAQPGPLRVDKATVVLIGNFDGVHRGHAALAQTAAQAAAGGPVRALVFDPHPLAQLRPADAPARLTHFEDRARLLSAHGVSTVERLAPEPRMLERSPTEFADWLAATYAPSVVVEGEDFCFGKGRAGDIQLLTELGASRGFAVRVVPPVQVVLDDHSVVKASSSLCRWLITQGRVGDAASVLGRPHTLVGTVVRGDRRGRSIGFPTANLDTPILLPGDGVYAARAVLPSGATCPAAVNVGERPTFAGAARTVEAHLIQDEGVASSDWQPLPGLAEYGWVLRLELLGFLRDQTRFSGLEALRAQLSRDCARTVEMVMRRNEREQQPVEVCVQGAAGA